MKNNKMKAISTIVLALALITPLSAQTVVKMEKQNGVYVMPCKVNGLSLKFIFDTGASDVSMSLTEALFMLKNGYLSKNDLVGNEYYQIANGDIEEGTRVVLKTIEIGKLKLYNVKASIAHNLSAPLLLGQSALNKLRKIEFDYSKNTLTIPEGPADYVYNEFEQNEKTNNSNTYTSKESIFTGYYKFKTTFDNPPFELPLRREPSLGSEIVYKCPKKATVYVIDNAGEKYLKVYVNGYTGYLAKGHLKRDW